MVTKMETEARQTEEKQKEIDIQLLLSGKQALVDESMVLAKGKPKKNKFLLPLGVVTALIAVAVAVVLWVYVSAREETDDAYVDGHISNISSKVSGTVQDVYVNENERVKSGEPLVRLDPTDYRVQVEQAKADLEESQHQANAAKSKIGQSSLSAQGQNTQATEDVSSVAASIQSARSDISQSEAAIAQAEAHVAEMEAQVQYAKSDFERYKLVFASRAVTQQQYDQAKEKLDVTIAQRDQGYQSLRDLKQKKMQMESKLVQAQANLRKSKGGVTTAAAAGKQEQIDEESYASQLSTVKRNQAVLQKARLQLSYTEIKAPISGRIGKKAVEVGQRIEPGQTLLALVQDDFWVTANFKETQVGRMHPGQPVEIKIDSFPGKVFNGHVDSVSPASGAKFSILPPDNATGNFTKVVQRISVKLMFDKDALAQYRDRISPGMSCVTTVLVKGP